MRVSYFQDKKKRTSILAGECNRKWQSDNLHIAFRSVTGRRGQRMDNRWFLSPLTIGTHLVGPACADKCAEPGKHVGGALGEGQGCCLLPGCIEAIWWLQKHQIASNWQLAIGLSDLHTHTATGNECKCSCYICGRKRNKTGLEFYLLGNPLLGWTEAWVGQEKEQVCFRSTRCVREILNEIGETGKTSMEATMRPRKLMKNFIVGCLFALNFWAWALLGIGTMNKNLWTCREGVLAQLRPGTRDDFWLDWENKLVRG